MKYSARRLLALMFALVLLCTTLPTAGAAAGDLNISSTTLYLQPYTGSAAGSYAPLTVSSVAYSAYLTAPYLTWTSSNPSVAQISGSGSTVSVYGVAAGQSSVTATLRDTSGTTLAVASCLVTVSGAVLGDLYLSSSSLQLQSYTGSAAGGYAPLTVSSVAYSAYLTAPYLTWTSSNPSVAQISGSGSTVYIYGSAAGQATVTATLTNGSGSVLGSASCLVTVSGVTTAPPLSDISYSLNAGQSRALSVSDFTSFWSAATGGQGTLNYVIFGAASGSVGKLVYSSGGYQSAVTSATAFYATPSSSAQRGLGSVSFVPSASGMGTLSVPFTAYGTSSYFGSTVSHNGTVRISVVNSAVEAITYTASGNSVPLRPADFLAVYRKAMNTSATPTVYIRFQTVPTFGSLYYSYGATSTKLTTANIGSLYFSSAAGGTYGIDNLTYVPAGTGVGDSIRYTAYNAASGTALYTGDLRFAVGKGTIVKYSTTPGVPVTFDASTFRAEPALVDCSSITLGIPTGGKLYTGYLNGAGSTVSTTDSFALGSSGGSIPSIATVTLVPSVSSGTVKIPFYGYSATNTYVGGTIEVYVAKSFPDVPADHWARPYIIELVTKGVVGGNNDGTFTPSRKLTYGEALKMILEATGYSATISSTGHWADNYFTLAYRVGLVPTASVNLDAPINRTAIAQIAAKALGLEPAYTAAAGVSNPIDSTDGYVQALYNAGILNGTNKNGQNYFNGSDTITRAEMSKITCLAANHYETYGRKSSVSAPSVPSGADTAPAGYVYTSEYSAAYHRHSICAGTSYPSVVEQSTAIASGRSACSVCYGG